MSANPVSAQKEQGVIHSRGTVMEQAKAGLRFKGWGGGIPAAVPKYHPQPERSMINLSPERERVSGGIFWISVEEKLPPMFEEVIVYGLIKSDNVCRQAYQARRWTGWVSGIDVEGEKVWEWLTPTDRVVIAVTHWAKLPKFK